MRVAVPHSLGKDEARRRLKARAHEIAGLLPGGMADVTVTWPHEDRMELAISALGKSVGGFIEVEESVLAFTIDLPPALAFAEPMVRGAVEEKGRKLLG